jgi:eukaryotic-like serine/threonine-protein kinase
MSTAWEDLERIFTDARQLPPDAREEFVARSCGTEEMRREALALLAADRASGDFLTTPALEKLAQSVGTSGWNLRPGDRLGVYTITRLLGAGGMGEVWRARDDRIGRDVAIKVLLPHLSHDAERVRRFGSEARAAGALNHPNIVTVYDVGEHDGMPYLVAECLEGRNLRQRLEAGPVPTDEAVVLALEITHGLAAAHASGIVHRDLKPENVFIRSDDRGAKILDFGLAKLQSGVDALPTNASGTASGVMAGTAGYIAPEQLKDEPADARADLFALGVILYEMLSGRHPFRCASTFETLNAVLTVRPPDLSAANEQVPASLSSVVMRLLEKAPQARFQTAIDLAWALEQRPVSTSGRSEDPRPVAVRKSRSRMAAWIAAPAVTAAVLLGAWQVLPQSTVASAPVTQFTVTVPPGLSLASAPAVSPDGQRIAFAGKNSAGSRLFVRALASREATAVPGSEGASRPFWAEDGRSLGFFAGGQLTTLAWPGGAPVALASAPFPYGASWSTSGGILFAPDVILTGIGRVALKGGGAEAVTLLDNKAGETSHWWPRFLPDGIHFLYHVRSTDDSRIGVYLGRVDRPSTSGSPIFRSDSDVVYVPIPGRSDGVLLYVVNGRIEARRFDAAKLTVAADAKALGLAAGGSTIYQPVMLSASPDVLAFAESDIPSGDRLEEVDRRGNRIHLWEKAEPLNWPRLSPDGKHIAVQRVDLLHNNPDIWVEDLERRTRVRITAAPTPDLQPVWSPDGRQLAYNSGHLPGRPGKRTLNIAAADGSGVLRSFPCPEVYCEPTDWSPDGRSLLINVRNSQGWDIWTVSSDDGKSAKPLLAQSFSERDARFSPDGRWIAYVSEETGRPEVSVRPAAGLGRRIVISANGGAEPVWRRDGSELFFVDPRGQLQNVPVHWSSDRSPSFAAPETMKVPLIGFGHWGTQYDVSSDGNRVYSLRENTDPGPGDIQVVTGWRARLD